MASLGYEIPVHVKKLTEGNLEFAFNIYQIIGKSKNDNLVVSPINIATAMTALYIGSRKNTAEEMKKALKLDTLGDDMEINSAFAFILESIRKSKVVREAQVTFNMATQMYIQNSFKINAKFRKCAKTYYDTTISEVDFIQDAKALNEKFDQWFDRDANGEVCRNTIPLASLNERSNLVVFNAVYFKAPWNIQFDEKTSFRGLFHKTASKKVVTKYMNLKTNFYFIEKNRPECKMLQLPYCGSGYEMYVILPREVTGLSALETSMTPQVFKSMKSGVQRTKVDVSLPKIKLETAVSLQEIAQQLGIGQVFLEDTANLTGISSTAGLHLSDIIHKVGIEVDGSGLLKAGQNLVPGQRGSKKMASFNANHPFMFIIYDNRREIVLFMGRFTEPTP